MANIVKHYKIWSLNVKSRYIKILYKNYGVLHVCLSALHLFYTEVGIIVEIWEIGSHKIIKQLKTFLEKKKELIQPILIMTGNS